MNVMTRTLPLLAALSLPLAACGDIEPAHVGGALHKAQPKPAPSAKVRPGLPRGTKIDPAAKVDENKADIKGIDRAVNIDENKANTKGIDRARDIDESKDQSQGGLNPKIRPQAGPGAELGPNGKPLIGEDARAPGK